MYNISIIANFFLAKEAMTQKKLQKLCYYAQAHYLAKYHNKLIDTDFEAWVHGPVSSELYQEYKIYGWNLIPLAALENYFPIKIEQFLDKVYEKYKDFSANELERLTHEEEPWLEARVGLGKYESSCISLNDETMRAFYSQKEYRIS